LDHVKEQFSSFVANIRWDSPLIFGCNEHILLCLSNVLENRCKNVALEALTTVGDGIVGQWNADLIVKYAVLSNKIPITVVHNFEIPD
jgi:hypothetical protein